MLAVASGVTRVCENGSWHAAVISGNNYRDLHWRAPPADGRHRMPVMSTSRVAATVRDLSRQLVRKDAADPHDPNPVDGEHVYSQLLVNYPPASIAWVRQIPWIGPVEVPLDRVDWDDEDSWAASHQPKRVKRFRKRLESPHADVNPVVGVQVPGDDRLKIVDGHHRALAYKKLGRPLKAYAGFAPSDKPDDPWFQAHSFQYHGGSSSLNKSELPSGQLTAKNDILKAVDEVPLHFDDGDPGDWEPVSFAEKTASGKIKLRLADLVKVGPEGYIHGYICVRPPCGPAYREAKFSVRLGVVDHGDTRIGRMRKNDDGTYSMTHWTAPGADGKITKTKLDAAYATRGEAAKSVALYHNVSTLHEHAQNNGAKNELADAKKALARGDVGNATAHMAQAEVHAHLAGDIQLETHIRDTRGAVLNAPKAVNAPGSPQPAALADIMPKVPEPAPAAPVNARLSPAAEDEADRQIRAVLTDREAPRAAKDAVSSARLAMQVGDYPSALKHLKNAAGVYNANGRRVPLTVRLAHDIIATHAGAAKLPVAVDELNRPEMPAPLAPEPVQAAEAAAAEPAIRPMNAAAKRFAVDAIDRALEDSKLSAQGQLYLKSAKRRIERDAVEQAFDRLKEAADVARKDGADSAYRRLRVAHDAVARHLGKEMLPRLADVKPEEAPKPLPAASGKPKLSDYKDAVQEIKDGVPPLENFEAHRQLDLAISRLSDPDPQAYANNKAWAIGRLKSAEIALRANGETKAADRVNQLRTALKAGEPVPALAASLAPKPLPGRVEGRAEKAAIAIALADHRLKTADRLTLENAARAINSGDFEAAHRRLKRAAASAKESGADAAYQHIRIAHDLIAQRLGRSNLPKTEIPQPEPAVPAAVPEPAAPKPARARNLPKAKAEAVTAHIDAAMPAIAGWHAGHLAAAAKAAVAAKDHESAARHLEGAHAAVEVLRPGNQETRQARDRLAMAHEIIAEHQGHEPLQARSITHADEHAAAIGNAARNIAEHIRLRERHEYLKDDEAVAGKLRAGHAADVIRDIRSLDDRARQQQGWAWGDQKTLISAARKLLNQKNRDLEKLNEKDLAGLPLTDRADSLNAAIAHADAFSRVSRKVSDAAAALKEGRFSDAADSLQQAERHADSEGLMKPFKKDISSLYKAVDNERMARAIAGFNAGEPEAVPGSALGEGMLGDLQRKRAEIRNQLAAGIKSGVKAKKSPNVRGIMGETNLITFNDGSRWVHKKPVSGNEGESDNEELASLVAHALGARAPVVVRDPLDKKSVYMTFVNGKTASELHENAKRIMSRDGGGSAEAADAMRRIGFLDHLIKNNDRHAGNYMIDQDGIPNAIDHGLAWPGWYSDGYVAKLVRKKDFTPEYYAQVRKNLEALKPEFVKITGNTRKYDDMMKQLAKWENWDDNGINRPK